MCKDPLLSNFYISIYFLQLTLAILQTDNVGVVGSPNSNEYYLAATNFPLSYIRLWEIAMSGINATFVDEETKEMCRRQMITWKEGEGTRWIK